MGAGSRDAAPNRFERDFGPKEMNSARDSNCSEPWRSRESNPGFLTEDELHGNKSLSTSALLFQTDPLPRNASRSESRILFPTSSTCGIIPPHTGHIGIRHTQMGKIT